MKAIIVKTTFDNKKEAKKVATILVEKNLAACVQISKIESVYKWKDEICVDKEWLLSIKTQKKKFEIVQREIKENHSYDLPQILAIEITNASKEYLKFIGESCK